MKIKDLVKKFDYRHYICIAITLSFIACAIWVFPYAFPRLLEGFRDIGRSIAFYFIELFGINAYVAPSINSLSDMPFTMPFNLPSTWEGFKIAFSAYWDKFTNLENFLAYMGLTGDVALKSSRYLLIIVPALVFFYMLFKKVIEKPNNNYAADTKYLVAFKRFSNVTYRPIKKWLCAFFIFVADRKYYWLIWLMIWAYSFNFFTIVLEFFAFYFYFVMSFDFVNIYRQFYKLFFDLSVVMNFIPVLGWFCIGVAILVIIRIKIAYALLNHMERQDRGFINERPIVFMVVGTMGKKKTTMITDMALSMEAMLRDKAYEKLLENDLKFPYFPWINLENSLRLAMENHSVYNLATCKRFVRGKYGKWKRRPMDYNLFGYDSKRYGMTYDDKLTIVDVWKVIENYVQLYFIYIIESSLMISNYSIRTDSVISDIGNFPLWDSDFFKRDSRLIDAYSRHSHILDFDSLRLGRKIIKDNPKGDCFEFGVVNLTEIGKERGNNLELQELKKKTDETNQKNDLFNSWLKMVRHSATVDNYPFVKVITDEQRPESWGADARDLCEIVHIDECSEMRLAMPFFHLEELLYDWIFSKFTNMYYQFRYTRGDNTLTMYALKSLSAALHHYYTRTYNRFGFMQVGVSIESGTQDLPPKNSNYFLMAKKIYSRRFSTDCFSDYFNEKALRTAIGIEDLSEFMTEKASFEEMLSENSYFFNDLAKIKENNMGDDHHQRRN